MSPTQRISLLIVKKPRTEDLNEHMQWFSHSLGLFGERDKERSCFRIFIELVKSNQQHRPLTSDQLASRAHLSRGTVIHHLNKLMDQGLVIPQGKCYILKVRSLTLLVDSVEMEMKSIFKDLRDEARRLDEELHLDN